MIAAPVRFRHLLWVLAIVAALYAAYGAWVVALRVQYPYDHLIWSESPFLTNMLKLHNGVELYGPPADASSFVYSPGLEYLCYALLSPFGLHLDVRACRVVNVAVGASAIIAASAFMMSQVTAMSTALAGRAAPAVDRAVLAVLVTAVSTLLLLKNFTFDVCHPDNLHALHLAGGIALAHRAMQKTSFRLAVATAALLGLGVVLKQTCALGGAGVALYLALWGRRHWGWKKAALVLVAVTVTTGLGGAWLLIHHEHGRFWLLDTLMRHTKYTTKLDYLFGFEATKLHRAPLWLGAAFVALRGLFHDDDRLRNATGLWLFAGIFGAAPALSAYMKEFGLYNNLVVVDLWAAMLVVPTLITFAHRQLEHRPLRTPGLVAAGALALVVLGLYPVKRAPRGGHSRYGRELEAALRADIEAGRRVLVAHGTAAWIRAGLRTVPLDRSNSVFELVAARHDELAHTDRRLASRHYDRIYVGWPAYGDRIDDVLHANYTAIESISPVRLPDPAIDVGWSPQMTAKIIVYAPRPAPR